MKEVVIVGGTRTAIGDFGGSLKDIQPLDLAQHVIKDVLTRATAQPNQIDKTIFGCCFAPTEQNITRSAAFKAGIPEEVPGFTVNGTCGSSIQAIISGTQSILCGESDAILAGGVESMSNAPYLLPRARQGLRMGHATLYDHMFLDGLEDAYDKGRLMGVFAEQCADKYGFTREAQDAFATASVQRAKAATASGAFATEITPVTVKGRAGEVVVSIDEGPGKVKLDKIPTLKPAFKKDGTITAANASQICDGASGVMVVSERGLKTLGVQPLARVHHMSLMGHDPVIMLEAPVPATAAALKKAGATHYLVPVTDAGHGIPVGPELAGRIQKFWDLYLRDQKAEIATTAIAP